MQTIPLVGLPTALSRIGLGCMRLSPEREADSFALVDTYLRHGGNLFDTAEIYGRGNSERALGDYFRRSGGRDTAVIVTKGCVEPSLVRPDYVRKAIVMSLERLQMDVIDIYLLHRDDPTVPVGELVDVLNEAVQAGRIRRFGVSNWTTARLAEGNRVAAERGQQGFCLTSPHLALAIPRQAWWEGCTHATPDDLRWYREQEMLVLGWSTQGRGFLLNDPPADPAHLADLIRVYYSPENLEKRQRLLTLAARRGATPGAIAIAYVLSLELATIALIGPLSSKELPPLMSADEVRLTAVERAWLELESSTLD